MRKGSKASEKAVRRDHRRALGQNFLVDSATLGLLKADLSPGPSDWVVEIGPGSGSLTRHLLGSGARVTAIEKDPHCVAKLTKKQEFQELRLLQGDAAVLNPDELADPRPQGQQKAPLLVGNLPYNAATAIVKNFLPHLNRFAAAYFMFQYEVAKRLCASPGSRDYGALTVYTQGFAKTELVRKVSPEAFRPRPNVLSATVRFTPLSHPLGGIPGYYDFLHQAFGQKRKKMTNSLERYYPKEAVRDALRTLDLSPECRAESVPVAAFPRLFEILREVRSRACNRP